MPDFLVEGTWQVAASPLHASALRPQEAAQLNRTDLGISGGSVRDLHGFTWTSLSTSRLKGIMQGFGGFEIFASGVFCFLEGQCGEFLRRELPNLCEHVAELMVRKDPWSNFGECI